MHTKKEKIDFFNKNCLSKSFEVSYTNTFLKQVKKHLKGREELLQLCKIIKKISNEGDLTNRKYKSYNLKGRFSGFREAHIIKKDMLIIWKKEDNKINLVALGTHAELFNL